MNVLGCDRTYDPWLRNIEGQQFFERRKIKFFVRDVDDSAGTTNYYGFTATEFQFGTIYPWMIMKEVITTTTKYSYLFGDIDYDKAWAIRATLTFDVASAFRGFHERYDIR